MDKLACSLAAASLAAAFAAVAAPAAFGGGAAADAGTIYEWVDDGGRMHASDTVPDKYKGVARRVDANRTRIPAAEQADAQRQAAALKAAAASAVPAARTGSAAARPGAAPAAGLNGSPSAADTPECAAWRRQIAASRECFIATSNRRGTGALRSCSNEPDPPAPAGCTP